jgi:hypothetical protein
VWKPTEAALDQAIASGDRESILMIWDRLDEQERVRLRWPIVAAVVFHHVEVANWLVCRHQPWLGKARRVAREIRAFDVLAGLPPGDEALPDVDGLLAKRAQCLEQLGVPLPCAVRTRKLSSGSDQARFDDIMFRFSPSLLIVDGESGKTFGALVATQWPKRGETGTDLHGRGFLFTISGLEAKRFPAAHPMSLFHDLTKIRVGELKLDLAKRECSIDASSRCTAAPLEFPAVSGRVVGWELWGL